MIFCTGCGKELHETAPMCPHCGKSQKVATTHSTNVDASLGPLWPAITSFVFGVLFMLAENWDSGTDSDTTAGCAMFLTVGLVLGFVSLNISKRGKGMAIAGIVMSAIGLVFCISN